MFAILFVLFVLGPIAEIFVLLTAGDVFGVFPVMGACVVTAMLGGWIIRIQGLAALNAAQRDLSQGRPPVDSAVDGALLAVAAPFLMTPGFITDAVGFTLLIPVVRRAIARYVLRQIKKRLAKDGPDITIDHP